MLINVDYHIIDKCNLNCVSCGHMCPLVPKDSDPRSLDKVIEDLTLLFHATEHGKQLSTLTLTGGEVTLHPQLKEVIKIAGYLFPNKVKLWSNGILYRSLLGLEEVVKKFNIKICITQYGETFSDTAEHELSRVYGDDFMMVDRRVAGGAIFNDGFFTKEPIISYDQAVHCEARQYCTQLRDGRIYPCQYLAYKDYLVNYFKDDLDNLDYLKDECYIDLRNNPSIEEIESFIRNAVPPMCNYCMDCLPNRPTQLWRKSDKNLKEWIH